MILLVALTLSGCGLQAVERSPYLSLIEGDEIGPNGDAVFVRVEEHARCAGFHRASADLAAGAETKVAFYRSIADDAETAAIQLASAKIAKDLAAQMVDEMATNQAARWSYLINADAKSDAVKRQAAECFDMATEQEEIIREVVKSKYGFSAR
jgi:hypothetical protein